MKPKKTLKIEAELEPKTEDVVTPSSRPEREDDDSEAVPPDAGTAEAEQEREEERASDDGMPAEDIEKPAGSGAP
jgi:hypothetical protein